MCAIFEPHLERIIIIDFDDDGTGIIDDASVTICCGCNGMTNGVGSGEVEEGDEEFVGDC
jgi:hypothetical protein